MASPAGDETTPLLPGTHANGLPTPAPTPTKSDTTKSPPKAKGSRRPNYALIHARKLPLDVYPLPSWQPHNPLSLAPFLYAVIRDFILPRSSHARCPYQATFSTTTRSVHVTDQATIRALWESGFFGKGTLSRSEPNWLDYEKRRLGLVAKETAEEYSMRRRKDREAFKKERARIEKELIEEVRVRESMGLSGLPGGEASDQIPNIAGTRAKAWMEERAKERDERMEQATTTTTSEAAMEGLEIVNQEHLQLASEEAFFLSYALGSLQVSVPAADEDGTSKSTLADSFDLLDLFVRHSTFPPLAPCSHIEPKSPFLLSYVAYHHFRSLGWVVRPGLKFSVDYLLYERGPVFTHATFAVLIIPSYSDQYWFETEERRTMVEKERKRRGWHWFHAMNRVQSQVLKTLVLCYVDVPGGDKVAKAVERRDVRQLLKGYKVREFCVKRWSANRNRE